VTTKYFGLRAFGQNNNYYFKWNFYTYKREKCSLFVGQMLVVHRCVSASPVVSCLSYIYILYSHCTVNKVWNPSRHKSNSLSPCHTSRRERRKKIHTIGPHTQMSIFVFRVDHPLTLFLYCIMFWSTFSCVVLAKHTL